MNRPSSINMEIGNRRLNSNLNEKDNFGVNKIKRKYTLTARRNSELNNRDFDAGKSLERQSVFRTIKPKKIEVEDLDNIASPTAIPEVKSIVYNNYTENKNIEGVIKDKRFTRKYSVLPNDISKTNIEIDDIQQFIEANEDENHQIEFNFESLTFNSIIETSTQIVNAIIRYTFLTFPLCLANLGLINGFLIIFIISLMSIFSIYMLIKAHLVCKEM